MEAADHSKNFYFIGENGEELKVHSFLLEAHSTFFRDNLTDNIVGYLLIYIHNNNNHRY